MSSQTSSSRTPTTLSQQIKQEFFTFLSDPNCDNRSFQLAVEAFKQHRRSLTTGEIRGLRDCFQAMKDGLAARAELLQMVDEGLKGPLGPTSLCDMALRICSTRLTKDIKLVQKTCDSVIDTSITKGIARAVFVVVLADVTVPLEKIANETPDLRMYLAKTSRRRC